MSLPKLPKADRGESKPRGDLIALAEAKAVLGGPSTMSFGTEIQTDLVSKHQMLQHSLPFPEPRETCLLSSNEGLD